MYLTPYTPRVNHLAVAVTAPALLELAAQGLQLFLGKVRRQEAGGEAVHQSIRTADLRSDACRCHDQKRGPSVVHPQSKSLPPASSDKTYASDLTGYQLHIQPLPPNCTPPALRARKSASDLPVIPPPATSNKNLLPQPIHQNADSSIGLPNLKTRPFHEMSTPQRTHHLELLQQ